ncbi:MAG: formate/nitrite transporter family protein [Verrucomicrobia bacterium]|nr:formate/nitrite transporter family protein [Verrucomicrobiota bacterium]
MTTSQTDQPPQTGREEDKREAAEIEERIAPNAGVVYATIVRQGEDELARPNSALAFSGLAAGLSMGFSFIAEALLTAALPDAPWRNLITKFGYSFGFLIVILGRQQLFTENTLTPVLPLLDQFTWKRLVQVCKLWVVVLIANMIGVCLLALVLAKVPVLDEPVRQTLKTLGEHVFAGPIPITFARAAFAGWLIALMVWLLPFAETARVLVIILLTYLIGLGRFDHIIAGSTEKFYLLFTGAEDFGSLLFRFWLPTLLGNMCGGILLVAVLNHGQVASGK